MYWKPKGWIAIVVGIIFQSLVFLYVNRPRLFFGYLTASVTVAGIDFFTHMNLTEDSGEQYIYLSWIFLLVCPVHGYIITKRYDENQLRGWYARWWVIPIIFAIYFVPILLFRAFLFEPFNMPYSSMAPTINAGDHMIVKKWGFGGYSSHGINFLDTGISDKNLVKRGGLYVFYPPGSAAPFVKRVIGLPGDIIEIKGYSISINGEELLTEFISDSTERMIYRENYEGKNYLIQRLPSMSLPGTRRVKVPDGHYFFLGDNRDNSSDSRIWGTVSGSDFVGEVVYVF